MKAIELIQFLGKNIHNESFLIFLETNHFNIKKLPKLERGISQSAKLLCPTFKFHGIELCFGFENEQLNLQKIVLFKPQSDGLLPVFEIDYPFGLYLNQKRSEYEAILGNFAGFDEPQFREYHYKKYVITIVSDPSDIDKKSKRIEIKVKQI